MSKSNQLNALFPGLARGPPQFNGAGAAAAGEPSAAALHLQKLLNPGLQATPFVKCPTQESLSLGAEAPNALPTTKITLINAKQESGEFTRGRRIGIGHPYLAYAVKDDNLRIIHAPSVKSALLKMNGLRDVSFCPSLSGLISTVSADGFAVVWELRVEQDQEFLYKETVRIRSRDATALTWHPKFDRGFALTHGKVVSLFQLTASLWAKQQESGTEGLSCEDSRSGYFIASSEVNWSCFSKRTGQIFVTGNSDGMIQGWDVEPIMKDDGKGSSSSVMNMLWQVDAHNRAPIIFTAFLGGSDSLFVTAAEKDGIQIRLWTLPNMRSPPTPVQEIQIGSDNFRAVFTVDSTGEYLYVAPNHEARLICFKLVGERLSQPTYYDVELPILHMASRRRPDGAEDILCQKTKEIALLTFDPKQFDSAKRYALPQTMPPAKHLSERKGSSSSVSGAHFLEKFASNGPKVPPTPTSNPTMLVEPTTPPLSATVPVRATALPDSKAVVVEVPNQQQASAGGFEAALEKQFALMLNAIQEESNKRAAKDLERQKSLLAVLSQSLSEIPEIVEQCVQESVREALLEDSVVSSIAAKVTSLMGPGIGSAVANAFDGTTGRQLSGDVAGKIAESIRLPISNAFAETFRENIVPAFEAGCSNMVAQWETATGAASAAARSQSTSLSNQTLHDIQLSIKKLTDTQLELMHAVRELQLSGPSMNFQNSQMTNQAPQGNNYLPNNTGSQVGSGGASSSQNSWSEIFELIQAGQYDNALMRALSEDIALVVRAINVMDPEIVFSRPPKLTNPVLLALMHQLSTDLTTDTALKLQWIQRSGMVIDATDESVRSYFAQMMETVVTNMQASRPNFQPGSPLSGLFELCYSIVDSKIYHDY